MGVLPIGSIVVWPSAEIPTGWAVCDGTNGTPDLRGKMVQGAGGALAVGDNGPGGAATEIGNHSHEASYPLSAVSGGHTHNGTATSASAVGATAASLGDAVLPATAALPSEHSHTVSLTLPEDRAGSPLSYHRHGLSGTTGAASASGLAGCLPICYAFHFIQRLN